MWQSETIEEAISRTGGRSRGFDYLRIGLSVAVVLWHSARTSYPDFGMDGWLRPTAGLILPMFFALSGFLVSGSLIRSRTVHEFVALRAIRIIPALAVETLLSLVFIGSLMTTLPWHQFIASHTTHKYLFNIIGWVHITLPGVFAANPFRYAVNASLWTIPFELECYLLIVILWVLRIVKSRWALLLTAIAIQFAVPLLDIFRHAELMADMRLPGRVLVISFAFGVALFAFREKVRLSFPLFVAAVLLAGALLMGQWTSYFVALPAAYATVYLGMRDPPKIPVIMDGDYSYGLYLYSFPIQQTIAALMPNNRHWFINFPLALVLAGAFAAASWHLVEKPILGQRKHLVGILDRGIDRLRRRKPRPDPEADAPMDIKAQTNPST